MLIYIKRAFITLSILSVSIGLSYCQIFGKKAKENISKDQQQQAEYIFSEGIKEYTLENLTRALDAFEKSLSIDKNNAAANYMIAQIYVRQNNLYKATQFAQQAINLKDDNKYYYLLLANVYERKQDFNEAAKVYVNLLKKIPNTLEHNYDLASVYLLQSKFDEAIKCYDKLEKSFGISEDVSRQKQQIFLKQGKLNDAINESKKLADAFPDDFRHVIALVELLITNEKFDEAEKVVAELVRKEPFNPFANLALHDIYKSKGDMAKANQKLEIAFNSPALDIDTKIGILVSKIRAMPSDDALKEQCISLAAILIKVHPLESKAYAMNADVLVISGKSQEALINYLRAINLDNSHNKIWQQIVILDAELNLSDSLKLHSEKALELFPNQSVFWFYNGLAYQFKKSYKKAIEAFEQGKKLSSADKAMLTQFNTLLGDSYNGLKEFKKSDECFDEVLKTDVNNYVVLNNYSYYLSLRKDKLEQAKRMSERVIKEYPENATYVDTYAWILYVAKDYEKAKEYFEKIVPNSTNGTIVEHYGDVLFQLGKKEQAIEQWKKAKSLGEASDLIDKKISDKKLYE